VTLEVYNIVGQRVITLLDGIRASGTHLIVWQGADAAGQRVASGVYLYRLRSGGYTETRKMLLLK
jgi:flagellar hook assembly protein FlgD